ncbi:Protease inhibitor precursor [compost metagenome]
MKKSWMILLTCLLAANLMAGTVLAKSDHSNGNSQSQKTAAPGNSQSGNTKGQNKSDKDSKPEQNGKADKNGKEDKDSKKATVTDDTYRDSATTSTYKGPNGYKGLLKAIENVEDKPAGAVLADLLLTKYAANLTPEMKARLEAIKDKDAALTAVAEILEQQGSVTDAVYVEQDAIKANVKNINSYKKLGKLYDKLGKKGIKLYVNGEEPEAAASIVQNGTTLVPFRVIAEQLGAEVSWNQAEQSVTITKDGTSVKLVIGSKTAYVNGVKVTLQTAPAVKNGTTLVPVRFVSQALKATVKYDGETKSVIIYEE